MQHHPGVLSEVRAGDRSFARKKTSTKSGTDAIRSRPGPEPVPLNLWAKISWTSQAVIDIDRDYLRLIARDCGANLPWS